MVNNGELINNDEAFGPGGHKGDYPLRGPGPVAMDPSTRFSSCRGGEESAAWATPKILASLGDLAVLSKRATSSSHTSS